MRKARWIIPILLMAVVAGCATLYGQKPFSAMSYQERGTFFQEMYNKQYDDALAMSKQELMSDAQLKAYRIKRELLIEVKPLIATYVALVGVGGTPTPEQEAMIADILNRIALAATK